MAADERTAKRLKKRTNAISASTCVSAVFVTTNPVCGPSLATASVAAASTGMLASLNFVREDVMRFALITGGDRGRLGYAAVLTSARKWPLGACLGSLGGSVAAVGIHLLLAYPRQDDVHTTAPIYAALAFGVWACMDSERQRRRTNRAAATVRV